MMFVTHVQDLVGGIQGKIWKFLSRAHSEVSAHLGHGMALPSAWRLQEHSWPPMTDWASPWQLCMHGANEGA